MAKHNQTVIEAFNQFWAVYPRKVGKLAALQKYHKALDLATPEEILEGVRRYIAHKPDYADWAHPRTFLSQGRWMDEYDTEALPVRAQVSKQTAALARSTAAFLANMRARTP